MKALRVSTAFKRDLKRMDRRGCDLSKLEAIVDVLRVGKALPASARSHPLRGAWQSYWDCHIEPDWVSIYRIGGEEVLLARTGTHADLFGR